MPHGSGGCAGWKPNPSLYASWFRRVCRLETKPQLRSFTLCHLYSEALQLGSQRPPVLFLRLGPLRLRCFSSLLFLSPLHHTALDDSLSPTLPSSLTSPPPTPPHLCILFLAGRRPKFFGSCPYNWILVLLMNFWITDTLNSRSSWD